MKKQIIQDERILEQKRKIGNEICSFLLVILLISMLVKLYIFNLPFSLYATEFICFWISVIYYQIRNYMLGNTLYLLTLNIKKIIVYSVLCGVTCSVLSGHSKLVTFMTPFFIVSILFFFVNILLYLLNQKRQNQINNQLNLEENVDE